MTIGRLIHIHTAAGPGRPMKAHHTARAIPSKGIEGDRYAIAKGKYSRLPGIRDVTLFEVETLNMLKLDHGIEFLPHEHRRNLTTEGVSHRDLIGQKFIIGEVTLEGLRYCSPCRYLNLLCKKQVSTRLPDQAGLFCRVASEGTLNVGDPIRLGA